MPHLRMEKLVKFYEKHRRMPSVREIAVLLGYKSSNAAHKFVQKLIDHGYASKDDTGRLIPGNGFFGIKMLGLVQAGFPTAAEEELVDTITIDEWMIDNRQSTYLLKVKGDSMIDAGIHEGDLVVAERTLKYKPGDIVIAEVDGEWTMKYLRHGSKGPYLEAANENYPDIHPTLGLKIAAVVKGVLRKY